MLSKYFLHVLCATSVAVRAANITKARADDIWTGCGSDIWVTTVEAFVGHSGFDWGWDAEIHGFLSVGDEYAYINSEKIKIHTDFGYPGYSVAKISVTSLDRPETRYHLKMYEEGNRIIRDRVFVDSDFDAAGWMLDKPQDCYPVRGLEYHEWVGNSNWCAKNMGPSCQCRGTEKVCPQSPDEDST